MLGTAVAPLAAQREGAAAAPAHQQAGQQRAGPVGGVERVGGPRGEGGAYGGDGAGMRDREGLLAGLGSAP